MDSYRIEAKESVQDFLRNAWIELAKEKVPEDIFKENFSEVTVSERAIYYKYISASLSVEGSIGYDREEPYTDIETYYEQEPYLAEEEYYDSDLRMRRTRLVTKYKRVQKERPVTKYKTVTDWSLYQGNADASGSAYVACDSSDFDSKFFRKNYYGCQTKFDKNEEPFSVPHIAESKADKEISKDFESQIVRKMPGDHYRDLRWSISDVECLEEKVYQVEQYSTSIQYKGETYKKIAFPFCSGNVGGDVIPNEDSPSKICERKKAEVEKEDEEDRENADYEVFRRTKWHSLFTAILLLTSCILSCFLRSLPPVITVFVLALACYVLNRIIFSRKETEVWNEIRSRRANRNAYLENEIKKIKTNYKQRIQELLNQKLKTLGLATYDEELYQDDIDFQDVCSPKEEDDEI